MNSSSGPAGVTLVSLPSKSLTADKDLSHDQREELLRLARTIRDEESARMHYEDQRRRLVIDQNANSASSPRDARDGGREGRAAGNNVPFSSNASVGSAGSSHRLNARMDNTALGFAGAAGVRALNGQNAHSGANGASAGAGHYSTDYFFDTPILKTGKGGAMHVASGKKPSQAEVDAAFKWLCIPRPLVIAERTPKEYVFAVVVATDDGSSSFQESKSSAAKGSINSKPFVFEWREGALRGGSVPDVLAGCVFVSEIKDISGPTGEMDTFTLQIGSSTRALKHSKGRTTVVVKCSSPGECAKYLASLRCIRRSYED